MLTHKKQLVLSFLLSTTFSITTVNAQSLFDEMIEEMNEMQARFERRFNRINEEMKKGLIGGIDLAIEHASIAVMENKTTQSIDVIIAPLSFKEKIFDASMDQDTNTLTVTTPAGNLTLQVERHLISAGFNHQIKQDADLKNGKPQVMMSSYSQSAKKVNTDMALEETKIEYDQPSQKLIVSIPFRKKTITKIPVLVKEGKEVSKEQINKNEVK